MKTIREHRDGEFLELDESSLMMVMMMMIMMTSMMIKMIIMMMMMIIKMKVRARYLSLIIL